MISADVFRGRYRESLEVTKPITANVPPAYRFADRNPQTVVRISSWRTPGDYRKAVQRIENARPGGLQTGEVHRVFAGYVTLREA